MKWVTLTIVLLLSGAASANDYTFSNGYYWRGGAAFTRSVVSTYDARGCLVNSYQYTPYVAPAVTVTPATPGWRTKLLEIAEDRNRVEAKLKQSAAEHAEYMEALKALGLQGSSQVVSQTSITGYGQRTAPQGATVYGYSGYNEIADIYGNVDLGDLYQSAIRLAELSNRNAAEAVGGTQKLVDNFSERSQGLLSQQLAIAEIQAKTAGVSQAAAALGNALKAENRIHIEKRVLTPPPPPPSGSPILDEPTAQAHAPAGNVAALINNKCVNCHGGKTTEANLNLTDLSKIDQATVAKIRGRIIHPDPTKRMPPGQPLSLEEVDLIFAASRSE